MKVVAVLAALVAATAAWRGGGAGGVGGRIVGGGEPAAIELYPDLVQVEFLGAYSNVWSQSCAGNILTSLWVLSAAHCFSGITYAPSLRRVRAGSTWRGQGGVLHYVLREYNHPDYDVIPRDADVTVVLLESALVWTPAVAAGIIAAPNSHLPAELVVTLAGWGALQEGGAAAAQLQHVELVTVDREECAATYGAEGALVTGGALCVGAAGRDACAGDAGGPVYYGGIVVGVVSWGYGCAVPQYPRVAAALAAHSQWVLDTVSAADSARSR